MDCDGGVWGGKRNILSNVYGNLDLDPAKVEIH